jgi:electron transport complex protein RnfD
MWLVSLCAVLTIFQSSLSDSFGSLIVAFTAVVTAIFTESLIYFRTERAGTIKDGSAITSALVLTLFLPNQLHPVYAALGAAFAMTVVKHSFGGVGANWMNPAVGGWLFIRFSWPEVFNNALDQSIPSLLSEGMSRGLSDPEGSPLGILTLMKTEYYPTQETFLDAALGFVLNDGLFARIQMEFPRSYISLFTTTAPGLIADRGIFALLAGTIIITASQASRGWIPAVYLGGYMVMVRLFGALPFGGSFGQGDLFFGLCSGGVLAAAFLSASDPATGPKSNGGAAAAGIAGGLITFFFRYYGLEAYGAFFAAALINTIVPILRDFESRNWYTYRKDRTNGKNEQTSEVP